MESSTVYQESHAKSALKAVVLYSEIESGLKARTLLQRVIDRAGWQGALDNVFWRFDVLSRPNVAREALYGAADADIVLLVAKGISQPPEWLLEWLEIWAISRRTSDAILAAWCHEHAAQEQVEGMKPVRQIAKRHGLKFVCAEQVRVSTTPSLAAGGGGQIG